MVDSFVMKCVFPFVCAALIPASASAQFNLAPPPGAFDFGRAVANAGDLDGDGVDDLAISGRAPALFGGLRDAFWAYSGVTQAQIWAAPLLPLSSPQAAALGLGDVNNDGVPDVVHGANAGGLGGVALVLSGADGSTLASINGSANGVFLGSSLAALGDINNDGVPDFAAAGTGSVILGPGGEVAVVDGATLTVLYRLTGGFGFGTDITAIDDLDGDGASELVVLDIPLATNVQVYSGATAMLLGAGPGTFNRIANLGYDYYGDGRSEVVAIDSIGTDTMTVLDSAGLAPPVVFPIPTESDFGAGIVTGLDYDGDGIPDPWFGVPNADWSTPGTAEIRVGAGGTVGGSFTGLPGEGFGFSLAGGDFDGNGTLDIAIGAPGGNRVDVSP